MKAEVIVGMVSRFCALCGKETNELLENLCYECYRRLHPLVRLPSEIEVKVCKNCFSYYLSGKWVSPRSQQPLSALREAIRAKVRKSLKFEGKVEEVKVMNDILIKLPKKGEFLGIRVKVKGKVHEKLPSYEEEYLVRVTVTYSLCPSCMVVVGGKEKAILQLRADGRSIGREEMEKLKLTISKALEEVYEVDKGAVILDWVEKEGSLDVYLASTYAARRIASYIQKFFAAKRLETNKVIGYKRGKPVTRLTIRLSLPSFRKGDVVDFKGNPLLIESISKSGVKGLLLTNYSYVKVPFTKLFRYPKLIFRREELVKAMVTSVNPPYVTLLTEPEYKQVEVKLTKIPLWIKEGAKVNLLEVRGKIFLSPIIA